MSLLCVLDKKWCFFCHLLGGSAIWNVYLPTGTISTTVQSSENDRVVHNAFLGDRFGFTVHVLSTNTSGSVNSELRVRAVSQLHGVQVSCVGLGDTKNYVIQILSIGKSTTI